MARILIVDDDPYIVKLLKMALENNKHEVDFAYSGEDGLDKVAKEKPELILLDVMMEAKDKGFDVARQLKHDPQTKDIPILMLTGSKNDLGFDFKKEAGDSDWLPVDAYIDKSEELDIIMAKVEELLAKKDS